jgi:NAD(P)-dependent dehydrogenase (short-subunit alcohol dehydrogenase family)
MTQAGRFVGKTVFVTGGDGGLGSAICHKFASEGASVAVGWYGKDPSHATNLVNELTALGTKAIAVSGNVASPQDVQNDIQQIIDQLGGVHIAVNNAGYENPHDILEMPYDAWEGVLNVNLTGPFLVSQAAGRWMAANGGGVIVNISSVHDTIPWATFAHYCASKAGLSMLTKCMAVALAERKIRVVTVSPGAIATPINKDVWSNPELLPKLLDKIPWGRIGQPADVANAVAFAASDDASYITGSTIYVDGAMTQYPEFQKGAV